MNEQVLFHALDLAGVFAFAVSGAVAARRAGLDLFGILALAYITACGGGIARDLLIGALPPASLANATVLGVSVLAAAASMLAYRSVERLDTPVRLFDAIGLGIFAVYGAHKALLYGHNAQVAILVGTITAIGGGMARDILLARVSIVLERELYATLALGAAAMAVLGNRLGWGPLAGTWLPVLACIALRYLSLRYRWHLPSFRRDDDAD